VLKADATNCFAHDASLQAQRASARTKGGHGKAHTARVQKLLPSTLTPVLALLLQVLEEARDGRIAPAQANAVATVASAIVKLYGSAVIEQQIESLQEQVTRLSRRSG